MKLYMLLTLLQLSCNTIDTNKIKDEQQYSIPQKNNKNIIVRFSDSTTTTKYQKDMLELINNYDNINDSYNWTSNGKGSPIEVRKNNVVILPKQKNGSYCSGYTYGFSLHILNSYNYLKNMSDNQIESMRKIWYGVTNFDRNDTTTYGLSTNALIKYNLGYEIKLEDAQYGDVLQVWGHNAYGGHSVIFLGFGYNEDDEIIAIRYASSQPQTNGCGIYIDYNVKSIEYYSFARIGKK
jgi:hypothetical protein